MVLSNTGEGSLSKYHQMGGGDTIWQISTDISDTGLMTVNLMKAVAEKAKLPQVKMVEIKLAKVQSLVMEECS